MLWELPLPCTILLRNAAYFSRHVYSQCSSALSTLVPPESREVSICSLYIATAEVRLLNSLFQDFDRFQLNLLGKLSLLRPSSRSCNLASRIQR